MKRALSVFLLVMAGAIALPSEAQAYWWFHIHFGYEPPFDTPVYMARMTPGSYWGTGECPIKHGCTATFPDTNGPKDLTKSQIKQLESLLKSKGMNIKAWWPKLQKATPAQIKTLKVRKIKGGQPAGVVFRVTSKSAQ